MNKNDLKKPLVALKDPVMVGIWVGAMSARLRESVASGNEPYLATAPAVAVGGISRGGIVAHNR